jgi:hypothetical protein
MKSTHSILSVLLLVQLGLGAYTWNSAASTSEVGKRKLIGLQVGDVTEVEIASKPSKEGEKVTSVKLVRDGENWTLASAGNYPAEAEKVKEVLKKLLALEVGTPIARRKANHNALRVGDRDYDRRIGLKGGGKTFSLVLGSAKGTSVYIREGTGEEVYWAKGLSTWALSDRASNYVDTQYVKLDSPTTVTIKNSTGEFAIIKDAQGDWSVSGLTPGVPLKQSEIQSFVDKAAKIALSTPVGKEVKPEYKLDEGVTVTLEKLAEAKKEGEDAGKTEHLSYRIGPEVDGKFYCLAEGRDFVVEVSKWAVEKLLQQKAEDFLKEEKS